jgi:hypothetical protein
MINVCKFLAQNTSSRKKKRFLQTESVETKEEKYCISHTNLGFQLIPILCFAGIASLF